MKKYQAPQIEVTKFEVEDIVTVTIDFSSFSLFNTENFGGWDDITEDDKGKASPSDL